MQIKSVKYGKTYGLPNYGSERIDLEASIDESEQEHIPMIVEILKGKCDAMHKANNPGLYIERIPHDYNNFTPTHQDFSPQPTETQPVKISPQDEENNLITSIESAQNEQELIQYKLLAAKNIKALGSYKKRAKQLNLE